MFFIRLGSALAWLGLIFGALRVGIGIFVGSFESPESRLGLAIRYLGTKSAGEAVDQGTLVIFYAVALGILAAIGRSVVSSRRPTKRVE